MAIGIKISVHPGGEVRVKAHPLIPKFMVDRFIMSKKAWIDKQVDKVKHLSVPDKQKTKSEFIRLKPQARKLVSERLAFYNRHYKYRWTNIAIRNQSTRWGSCSRNGRLSFNFRLATVSPDLLDYVVVHELCHLKHMNHSQKFWELVGETLPNYKNFRKKLRRINQSLF